MIKKRLKNLFNGIGIGLIGALIIFNNYSFSKMEKIWADDFDGRFIMWVVEWVYQSFFNHKKFLSFWHSPAFYPHNFTLAYSDSLLTLQIFYSPLRMLGLNKLSALYLSLAGFVILGMTLTYCALSRIESLSFFEKALIVVSGHLSLSFLNFLHHYQLFGFHLAIPFIIYLYLFYRKFKINELLKLTMLFIFSVGFSTYLAPMLLTISLILFFPYIINEYKKRKFTRITNLLKDYRLIFIIVLLLIFFIVQIMPYLIIKGEFPKQDFEETSIYSARPWSLLVEFSHTSKWYSFKDYAYGDWERAYFPGIILLILSGIFFILYIPQLIRKKVFKLNENNYKNYEVFKEFKHIIIFSFILFVIVWLLSWGPYMLGYPSLKFPFYYLSFLIPGLRDIRAPGRFGIFIGLCLGIFSVISLRIITKEFNSFKKNFSLVVVILFFLLESFPTYEVYEIPEIQYENYVVIGEVIKEDEPIIELPVTDNSGHYETIKRVIDQLQGTLIHKKRILVGYGAKTTPEHNELLDLDRKLQESYGGNFISVIKFAKEKNIQFITIHKKLYPSAIISAIKEFDNKMVYDVIFDSDTLKIIRINNIREPIFQHQDINITERQN